MPIIYSWFTKPDENVLATKQRLLPSEIESYGDTKVVRTPIGSFFKTRNISTKIFSNSEIFLQNIQRERQDDMVRKRIEKKAPTIEFDQILG